MTPELQIVVDRLEAVEGDARGWKMLALFSFALAAVAVALPFLMKREAPAPGPSVGRFTTVEAGRFLLRDPNGTLAGGMEVAKDGGLKLVLGRGYGEMGAAFLEVQRDGVVHLTLRGPDGAVRAALQGSSTPFLALSNAAQRSGASLMVLENGAGAIQINDRQGHSRFKVP